MMKLIILFIIVMSLLSTATPAPLDTLDSDHEVPTPSTTQVKIPAYIKKIYNKMSRVMEQDDLNMSMKYLRTVGTVHWLEPIRHGKTIHTHSYVHYIFVPPTQATPYIANSLKANDQRN